MITPMNAFKGRSHVATLLLCFLLAGCSAEGQEVVEWVGTAGCDDGQTGSTPVQPFCSLGAAFNASVAFLASSSAVPPFNLTFLILGSYGEAPDVVVCDGCIPGEAILTLASAVAAPVPPAVMTGLSFSLTSAPSFNYSLTVRDLVFTDNVEFKLSKLTLQMRQVVFQNIGPVSITPITLNEVSSIISNCTFSGTRTTQRLLSISSGENLIEDSSFQDNQGYSVGAIVALFGVLRLHRCTFINNTANGGTGFSVCGAVFSSQQSLLEVKDSLFTNNTALTGFSTGAVLAQILTAKRADSTSYLSSSNNTFIGNSGGTVNGVWASQYNVQSTGDRFLSNVGTQVTFRADTSVFSFTFSMEDALFQDNGGLALALTGPTEASLTTSRFINNADGAAYFSGSDQITVSESVFIANNWGIDTGATGTSLNVSKTLIVGNRQFGVASRDGNSILMIESSVYRNGFTNDTGTAELVDIQCGTSSSLTFYGDPNLCINAGNPCPAGLDQCGRCAGDDACVDCSGAAYGEATLPFCDTLTKLGVAPSPSSDYWLELEFQGENPSAFIFPIISGVANRDLSVAMNFTTIEVYNSSASTNEEPLLRQKMNDIIWKRFNYDLINLNGVFVRCVAFEGVVANGGFLTLTECLIQDQNVTVEPITGLPVQMPTFSLKFDVKFSFWKGRGAASDGQRLVRLSLDVALTQDTTLIAGQPIDLDGPSGLLEFNQSVVQAKDYFCPVGLLNFALMDERLVVGPAPDGTSDNGIETKITSQGGGRYLLELQFDGDFDDADYDPNLGLLLDDSGGGGSDDLLLVKILVPVLVGVAILIVVGTILTAVVVRWVLWKRIYGGRGLVNFRGDDI